MRVNTSLVIALGMGMAVSCFAGERNTQQRQVKSVDTAAVGELDYSSIVLDENLTVTIVSDAAGNMIDAQMLQIDGEEAVTVSILTDQQLMQVRKVPQSIDTSLKYETILVDNGLTATMITDANGNLIGVTASTFDGDVVTTSSTSDDNVIMATKDLRILSVGDVAVAVGFDEVTRQWNAGAVIDMPLSVTNVATDGTGGNTPDAVTCSVSVALISKCSGIIVHSCGGQITVFTLCRKSTPNHGECSGDWYICGATPYNP